MIYLFLEFLDFLKYFLSTFLLIRLKPKQTFCIPKHFVFVYFTGNSELQVSEHIMYILPFRFADQYVALVTNDIRHVYTNL